MVKIAELSSLEISALMQRKGLSFQTGPFTFRLSSNSSSLAVLIQNLYADYPLKEKDEFADFELRIVKERRLRYQKPYASVWFDEKMIYPKSPEISIFPFVEWGLNFCVATNAHQYLILHSGTLERNGQALLLPAWPGSGKSTLSAALSQRGWRLLSDEFGLVRPSDLMITPFPRLLPLKNQSIAVMRSFAPEAVFGPEYPGTPKGTVCHLRPPPESIDRAGELARARWIVFPKFRAGSTMCLNQIESTEAFVSLSGHAFNYELIGLRGFKAMTALVDACDCYTFEYGGDLEQAVAQLNALADGLI
ncbi:MAG TPA: HprK-related kinase A [Candidatus Competibacteraceae bacterium]|nr:HprK-related kinase A [Candidatus Competibacteraceae bacterium]MCP5132095.1 HprK-related kinase A [Gammaproteobacteria bacterium]HPF58938.1 HprK-related kinase A [Candidatus Competibacteraceae bacterium]HRY16798.1 HprK-related kinase A [Candidatus Competibacteraceae bacterium]